MQYLKGLHVTKGHVDTSKKLVLSDGEYELYHRLIIRSYDNQEIIKQCVEESQNKRSNNNNNVNKNDDRKQKVAKSSPVFNPATGTYNQEQGQIVPEKVFDPGIVAIGKALRKLEKGSPFSYGLYENYAVEDVQYGEDKKFVQLKAIKERGYLWHNGVKAAFALPDDAPFAVNYVTPTTFLSGYSKIGIGAAFCLAAYALFKFRR